MNAMKKLKHNKLTLDRETLVPLTNHMLDNVAGGANGISQAVTTLIKRISCISCTVVCAGGK